MAHEAVCTRAFMWRFRHVQQGGSVMTPQQRTKGNLARTAGAGLVLGLLALMLAVAPVSAGAPTISATPNPVVIPFGGTTAPVTIAWNSGTPGVIPLYCVKQDTDPEQCFPGVFTTPSGSVMLNVTYGHTYVSTIYASGTSASVTIHTEKQQLKPPYYVAYNADPGCIVCGSITTDPRAAVVNPAIINPAVNSKVGAFTR